MGPVSGGEHRVAVLDAVRMLRRGGLVVFPTETVYGLGARVFDPEAIRKVFAAKGRPVDNPLIVHLAGRDQLNGVVVNCPEVAHRLMRAFWPGPLTLVLPRAPGVPSELSAGLDTVAVRMPDHPVALALIRELGEPIAAPSANRSGRPSPTRVEHAVREVGDAVDLVLDGGPCRIGLESTVLDLTSDPPRVLRPGAVTLRMLRAVVGRVLPFAGPADAEHVRSPGLRHRHYAPDLRVVLVSPEDWPQAVARWSRPGRRLGLIGRTAAVPASGRPVFERSFDTASAFARNLFAAFHDAEAAGVQVLLVEALPREEGLGAAIMDRLERAATAHVEGG
ncbi:MAG: L-threonylcarbamoyladenylate synthase [Nitrospiria bacterium]